MESKNAKEKEDRLNGITHVFFNKVIKNKGIPWSDAKKFGKNRKERNKFIKNKDISLNLKRNYHASPSFQTLGRLSVPFSI